MSLQFDLCNEIYCFTGTKPRFPDPIPTDEKLSQMPLTSLFFSLAPKAAQVADTEHAQLLASTLGAVHALANPLSFWQSIKSTFAFCGNRKGQLTSKLNEQIMLAMERSCTSPAVAAAVKAEVVKRSQQVKQGIKTGKGSGAKNFNRFGQAELASLVSVSGVEMYDLAALSPVSKAFKTHQLDQHRGQYNLHRQKTEDMVRHAKGIIEEVVSPVQESS